MSDQKPTGAFQKRPARDTEKAEANRLIPVPLQDGITVEAVFYGGDTLCLSTQAGCAIGCPFCASGSKGLFRSLSVAEMQQQVDAAKAEGLNPVRLTLSGVGEPLMNHDAAAAFIASSPLPVSLTTTGTPPAASGNVSPENSPQRAHHFAARRNAGRPCRHGSEWG